MSRNEQDEINILFSYKVSYISYLAINYVLLRSEIDCSWFFVLGKCLWLVCCLSFLSFLGASGKVMNKVLSLQATFFFTDVGFQLVVDVVLTWPNGENIVLMRSKNDRLLCSPFGCKRLADWELHEFLYSCFLFMSSWWIMVAVSLSLTAWWLLLTLWSAEAGMWCWSVQDPILYLNHSLILSRA